MTCSTPCVIGVDPGLDGGIAALTLDGVTLDARPMPTLPGKRRSVDAREVFGWLAAIEAANPIRLVAVEHVTAMRTWGVTATFEFGCGFGRVLAVVESRSLALELVRPARWQKSILGAVPKGQTKPAAIAYAARRFPGSAFNGAGPRTKRPHDGVCDALCLAEFARRFVVGEESLNPTEARA